MKSQRATRAELLAQIAKLRKHAAKDRRITKLEAALATRESTAAQLLEQQTATSEICTWGAERQEHQFSVAINAGRGRDFRDWPFMSPTLRRIERRPRVRQTPSVVDVRRIVLALMPLVRDEDPWVREAGSTLSPLPRYSATAGSYPG